MCTVLIKSKEDPVEGINVSLCLQTLLKLLEASLQSVDLGEPLSTAFPQTQEDDCDMHICVLMKKARRIESFFMVSEYLNLFSNVVLAYFKIDKVNSLFQ